jgi:hypothetical protein
LLSAPWLRRIKLVLAQLARPFADPSNVLQVGQTCTAWRVGAHLVLSALIEAALLIADAVNRAAARAAAEQGLRLLLSGLLLQPFEVRAPEKP